MGRRVLGGRTSPSLSAATEEYPPRSPPHFSPIFSPFGEEDGGAEAWGESKGDLRWLEWETEGDTHPLHPALLDWSLVGKNVSAAVVKKIISMVMLIAELAVATHAAAMTRLRAAAAEGSQTQGASAGTSQGAAAGTSRVSTEATTPAEESTPEAAPRTRARPG